MTKNTGKAAGARRLDSLMKSAGYSNEDLEDLSGLSKTYISQFRNNALPTLLQFLGIAKCFAGAPGGLENSQTIAEWAAEFEIKLHPAQVVSRIYERTEITAWFEQKRKHQIPESVLFSVLYEAHFDLSYSRVVLTSPPPVVADLARILARYRSYEMEPASESNASWKDVVKKQITRGIHWLRYSELADQMMGLMVYTQSGLILTALIIILFSLPISRWREITQPLEAIALPFLVLWGMWVIFHKNGEGDY